jgi:hypothetical protein
MHIHRVSQRRVSALSVCALLAAGASAWGGAGAPAASARPADPNSHKPGPVVTALGSPQVSPQRPPWHDDPNIPRQQDPKALEILKAGIKALGGEEAIFGRKTIYIKRKVTSHEYPEPREGTVTIWFKRPNKIRKEISYPPDKTRVEAFDGQHSWYDDGTGPKVETQGVRAAAILDGIQELDLPASYLDAELTYFNISQEIPGKLAHVVKVRKNGYTRELMFDVGTYLLQVVAQYQNPWGADDKMTRFDRYRPVDGVLVPYREERWRSNRMVNETEIIEIRFNAPIDDALFEATARP